MDLFDPALTSALTSALTTADLPVVSGCATKTRLRRPLAATVRAALPLVGCWVLNWTALGARLGYRRRSPT